MSSEEPGQASGGKEPIKVIVEREADAASNRTASVEVVSLEIDDDFDLGSDPYNRTGQFMVLDKDFEDESP